MANIYDTLIEQERQTTGITPTQASSNSSNIYDDIIIKERSDAQQYRSAVMEAVKTSPDRAAQVQKISKELLLPTAVVDRNMDDLDRLARARRLELLRAANDDPVLARQLSDSEFAKIAQDDTDNLSFTGKVFKFFRDTVTDAEKGFKSGRLTNELGFLGERAKSGEDNKAMWAKIAELQLKQKQLKGTGGFIESAAQIVGQQFDTMPDVAMYGLQAATAAGGATAIAGQLGPQAVLPEEIITVPAAMVAGFTAGSIAKMSEQSYRIEAGANYLDMLESGVDKDVARYVSTGVGMVIAALEVAGMKFVAAPFKKLLIKETTEQISKSLTKPTMQAALKQFGKDYAGAVLGETSTEVLQEISNVIGEEIGRSMSDMQNLVETEEGRKQIGERLTGIFEQVTKGMAVLAIPGAGLHFRKEIGRVKDAEKNAAFFDSLAQGADTSKVLERNPDAYHSFISNQAADAQVENIYIDGKVFAQTLNQHGIKAEELDQVVPGLSEKVQAAALTGGDVVMSTADYATHLAKADLGKAMLPHVRTDASALSIAEANQAGSLAQQLFNNADQVMQKNEERKEWVRSANEVQKTMFDQIKGTGAYSDPVSRLYAATVKAFYVNLADRNGTTPMEEYQKNPYKVEMGEIGQGQSGITYNQEGNINIDENFKNWFGESKVVDSEGKPLVVYHGSRSPYIDQFDLNMEGTGAVNTGNKKLGGVWFTSSKNNARFYADAREGTKASLDSISVYGEKGAYYAAVSDVNDESLFQVGPYQTADAAENAANDAVERYNADPNRGEAVFATYLALKNPFIIEGTVPREKEFKAAKDAGHDGIIAKNVVDGQYHGDVYVAFSPTQIKSVFNRGTFDPNNPNILNQFAGPGAKTAVPDAVNAMAEKLGYKGEPFKVLYQTQQAGVRRGGYDPSRLTTILTQESDYSSFLHETSHFFLDVYSRIAADPNAPARIKEDMQTMLDWFGVESLEAWNAMTLEEQRKHHEAFAYNFEIWVAEGKSPSVKMENMFRTFGRFLKQVYENIRDELNQVYRDEHGKDLPILTGEVRQVMERMLASEKQIKEGEQVRAMAPIFEVQPESMSDEEWAAYREMQQQAHDNALDEHTRASLRQMKWLEGAKSKFLKQLQGQVKDIRKQVGEEVAAEVQAEPVYRAIRFMKTGEYVSGDGSVTRETKGYKLSIPALKDMYPERPAKQVKVKPPKLRSFLGDISKAGGITYDSLVRSLDVNEIRGANGGNRFMAITGRKGRGWGMDQMAGMMQDQGWHVPMDADGNLDTNAFSQMVKDAVNGNTPVHPDDIDVVAQQEEGRALSDENEYLDSLVESYRDKQIDNGYPDWKELGYGKGGLLAEDGIHPDVMAGLFGFHSGDALVHILLETAPIKKTIQSITDQRMLEEHGELTDPDAIQEAVDRAIHNDLRAKFIGVELRHLSKTQRPVRVMQEAARRAAVQMLDTMRLKDLRPSDYAAAEAKASKAADAALKKGDIAAATTAKEQQLLQNQLASEALKLKEQMKKDLQYLEKIQKDSARKKMGPEAADQIDMLLEKFDLKPPSMKQADEIAKFKTWVKSQLNQGQIPDMAVNLLSPEERRAFSAEMEMRDEEGELIYKDEEDAALMLAEAIDKSAKRPYYDLTFDEWQGLVDTVRNIHHLGKTKTMMLAMADGLSYEQTRDEIANSIVINAKKGGKNTRTASDWLGKKFEALKQFGASHIKVATWARIMDGGKDDGPMWRFFIQTANERANWETTQRAAATEKLAAILAPILKKVPVSDKVGKGRYFESIGESLNWEARMAIAMNYGNDSNLQRLLDGMGWTIEQIMPVLNSLTMEEWKAAEAIGAHFESYRPQIAEKEKRVTGKEPKWIEPREFAVMTADGQRFTSKGWYYPVVFDPRLSLAASQHAAAEESKNQMKAAYNAATTRRSFVKERVEKVVGRPVLLTLQGLYSGVNDVIHDLAWHEWVIDANKLLRSKSIDGAIREHYGPEIKKEFEKWRDDIVAGTRRLDHSIEKAAGFFRQSVSMAGLGFNIVSALMQPFGLINSGVRIGHRWMGHGIAQYISNGPAALTREVKSMSSFMDNRARTRFRELNELRNQIQGQTAVKEVMGRYAYWMMMQTQMIVDVITWKAAYDKAMSEGHFKADEDGVINDRTAINLADQAVKDAQGGGEEIDQAGVERGGPLIKLFTTFYSFMATTANVAFLEGMTEKSRAKAAVNIILVLSVQPMLGALLRDAVVPGGDDDDEKIAKKLAAEQISFLLGLVAFGREFSQAGRILAGDGKGIGYSGPPGLRMISDVYKLAAQARQGEFDVAFAKAFVNVLGDATGIPSVQVNRLITGAKALSEGKTKNPAALIMGYQNP